MDKLKKEINVIYAGILLFLTLPGWAACLLGYHYRSQNYCVMLNS